RFCKPQCPSRRYRRPLPLNARRPATNDGGGSFASQTQGGNEPLGRGRRCGGADLYGGARHHNRRGRAALYRRRPVGDGGRRRMGYHELPRRQRHYFADPRLAEPPLRPPQLLPRVDRCIYCSLGAVRDGHEPLSADSIPRNPRPGRRRAAAEQPGSAARCLPARKASSRNDPIWLGCPDRAGPRSAPRRMDYGQLFVAVGLLYQSPVGLLAWAACYVVVHDPDYLTAQRAEQRRQASRFDTIGLSLLVITMVSWEVMLSKGEEWNWLGDVFGRI